MAQTLAKNHAQRGYHQYYARMTHPQPQRHVVPTIVLTMSKLVLLTAARPVTTAVPQPHVTRPRLAKTVITKPHSPPRRNINHRPSPNPSNIPPKVTTVKAPMVNAVKVMLPLKLRSLSFKGKKPESEVHVSPSSSAKTNKHDEKTKREAKGKIPTVGQISTNNTNTFSAAGPSHNAVSPTLRESSYVDTSQYLNDPNMIALEDITYSDDDEDVGAEADFTNLETTITVSPI
nr:hypothetical protein [Tanacetum cinerariifolium]